MADNFFDDDVELVQDEDNFFGDDAELVEDEMSQLEAGLRGGAQGLTFDFGDELMGGALAAWDVATGDPKLEDLKELYKKHRDEQRMQMEQAAEEHPATYYGSDIAAGVLPALLTGGGTAAASVGKAVLKGAAKKSLPKALGKAAAKGVGYGAATGAGTSTADLLEGEVMDFSKDVGFGSAVGGAMGAGLPLVGKAAKKGLDITKNTIKGAGNLIPGAEAMGLGYKAGKRGLGISQDDMIDEALRVGKELDKKVKKVLLDSGVSRDKAVKLADEAGVRINAGESIDEVVESIIEEGAIGLEVKSRDKLVNSISALKKGFNEQQELLKLESRAANQSVQEGQKHGSELETISEINTNYDDALILPDAKGKVKGLRSKYSIKSPEGVEEYTKILTKPLDDSVVKRIEYDTESMSPSQLKSMLGYINDNLVGDMTKKASTNERYARKLAVSLRSKLDDAVEEFADPTGTMAKTYQGMNKLGVKEAGKATETAIDNNIDSIAKKLLSTGSSSDIDKRRAFEYFKKSSPEYDKIIEEAEFISRLNDKLGGMTEGVKTTNMKGLMGSAEGAVSKATNLAGKGVRATSVYTKPLTQRVSKVANKVNEMSDDFLNWSATRMMSNKGSGGEYFGKQLQHAMSQEGPMRNALLWSLSQQPGFRSIINKQEKEYSEDVGFEPNYLGDEPEENSREPQGMVEDSVSGTMSAPVRDDGVEMEDDRQSPDDTAQQGFFDKYEEDQVEMEDNRPSPVSVEQQGFFDKYEEDKMSEVVNTDKMKSDYKDLTSLYKRFEGKRDNLDSLNEYYEGETKAGPNKTRTVELNLGGIEGKLTGGDKEPGGSGSHGYKDVNYIDPKTGDLENLKGEYNVGFDYIPANPQGYAPMFGGEVVLSGIDENSEGHGNSVIIKSPQTVTIDGVEYDTYAAYGHNENNLVKGGQVVDIDSKIAEMGGTSFKNGKMNKGYNKHVDIRTFVVPKGEDWNVKQKLYINPKQLEELQKSKDRETKQLGSGAFAGTERSSLDDLMGRLGELEGISDTQRDSMEFAAMSGDMNMLQELMDKYKGNVS